MIHTTLPTEMLMLAYTLVLVIVQLLIHAGFATVELGLGYNLSPRDEQKEQKWVIGQRATRAYYNILETFPLFAAAALAVQVTGHGGEIAALGAQLYFWSRVAYVPIYLAGIPAVRTLIWTASMVGICMMIAALFH